VNLEIDNIDKIEEKLNCLNGSNWISPNLHYMMITFSLYFNHKFDYYFSDTQYSYVNLLFEISPIGGIQYIRNLYQIPGRKLNGNLDENGIKNIIFSCISLIFAIIAIIGFTIWHKCLDHPVIIFLSLVISFLLVPFMIFNVIWGFYSSITWDIMILISLFPISIGFIASIFVKFHSSGETFYERFESFFTYQENYIDLFLILSYIALIIISIYSDICRSNFNSSGSIEDFIKLATSNYSQRIIIAIFLIGLTLEACDQATCITENIGVLIIVFSSMFQDFALFLISTLPAFIGFSIIFPLILGNLAGYANLFQSLLQTIGSVRAQFNFQAAYMENRFVGTIFFILWDAVSGLFLINILLSMFNDKYSDIVKRSSIYYRRLIIDRTDKIDTMLAFVFAKKHFNQHQESVL
jgi:hypothetical protein